MRPEPTSIFVMLRSGILCFASEARSGETLCARMLVGDLGSLCFYRGLQDSFLCRFDCMNVSEISTVEALFILE